MIYKLLHVGSECSRVAGLAARDFAQKRTRGSNTSHLIPTDNLLSQLQSDERAGIVVPTFKTPNLRLLPNAIK